MFGRIAGGVQGPSAFRGVLLAVAAGSAVLLQASAALADTQTFTSPGTSTFTVPAGVTNLTVTAVGSSGGTSIGGHGACSPGRGATITATLPVSAGQVLSVVVAGPGGHGNFGVGAGGSGGIGGGGTGGAGQTSGWQPSGAGGGGASSVSAASPLLVGGGGGGAGGGSTGCSSGGDAGSPGGNLNVSGSGGPSVLIPGTGGGAGGTSAALERRPVQEGRLEGVHGQREAVQEPGRLRELRRHQGWEPARRQLVKQLRRQWRPRVRRGLFRFGPDCLPLPRESGSRPAPWAPAVAASPSVVGRLAHLRDPVRGRG
jgi:hypothetical protein